MPTDRERQRGELEKSRDNFAVAIERAYAETTRWIVVSIIATSLLVFFITLAILKLF